MGKIKSPNHQLNTLIQQDDREHEYNLRNDNNRNFYLFNNRPYCRTKLCGDFFQILLIFIDILSDILNKLHNVNNC